MLDWFVFGTQYYRAPTPPQRFWKTDLQHIRKLGMNTIKIFVEWAWVERAKGQYDLSQYDQIIDLAEANDLKVVPNLIIYNRLMPSWPREELGAEPFCLDSRMHRDYAEGFFSRTVRRYKVRECLLAWDVWNEPSIRYCHCGNTLSKFRRWLEDKYGTVENYVQKTGNPASSWKDIIPSPGPDFYSCELDFYKFSARNLYDQIAFLRDLVKAEDKMHPVTTHDVLSGCTDPFGDYDDYENSRSIDIYGLSAYGFEMFFSHPRRHIEYAHFPLCLDIKRAMRKEFWVSEIFSGAYVFSIDGLLQPSPSDIRMNLWTCLAHGASGILLWQFKPEMHGISEAGGEGLVNRDGSDTGRSMEAKVFADQIGQHEETLKRLAIPKSGLGVLVDPTNKFVVNRHAKLPPAISQWKELLIPPVPIPIKDYHYKCSLVGAYHAFWSESIPVDLIYPQFDLDSYETVYVPFLLYMEPQTARKLRDYVGRGGRIVSEAGLGMYLEDAGFSPNVPSYGLDEVFGLQELDTVPIESDEIRLGKTCERFEVAYQKKTIRVGTAEIIGEFLDGSPAVLGNRYGKGEAYYVASYPSLQVYLKGESPTSNFIRNICGIKGPMEISPGGGEITARLLDSEQKKVLIVFNHSSEAKQVSIKLALKPSDVTSIRGSLNLEGDVLEGRILGQDVCALELTLMK